MLFNATVEKSALRRRASRLLAIAGAPRRKPRELILTDKRLICVKHKPGRNFQLSNELWLKSVDRDTDPKTTIVSAEQKGEREFVVMTVRTAFRVMSVKRCGCILIRDLQGTKSFPYLTLSSTLTTTWLRKIHEAIKGQESATTKPPSPTTAART